jgi:hypothetical protein
MNTLWIKILGWVGAAISGAGVGAGIGTTGGQWYEIVLSVLGMLMIWLLGSKFALSYMKLKAVIDSINDMLADDKITLGEIKAVITAFKTGKVV